MTTFWDLPLPIILLIARFCGPAPAPALLKEPEPEPARVYSGPRAAMRSGWYFAPDF